MIGLLERRVKRAACVADMRVADPPCTAGWSIRADTYRKVAGNYALVLHRGELSKDSGVWFLLLLADFL